MSGVHPRACRRSERSSWLFLCHALSSRALRRDAAAWGSAGRKLWTQPPAICLSILWGLHQVALAAAACVAHSTNRGIDVGIESFIYAIDRFVQDERVDAGQTSVRRGTIDCSPPHTFRAAFRGPFA